MIEPGISNALNRLASLASKPKHFHHGIAQRFELVDPLFKLLGAFVLRHV